MSSVFGNRLRCSVFGQSHGQAVGAVLDGLPAGEAIDMQALQAFLNRRAPGNQPWATRRKEPDLAKILSGVLEGKSCGAPITMAIENTDQKSADYAPFANQPRPGHADFVAHQKHGGMEDGRGGGHFSGRVMAGLCLAGGVCLQFLERRGILIGGHILKLGGVQDTAYDPVLLDANTLNMAAQNPFPTLNAQSGQEMIEKIAQVAANADSIGGVIELGAIGLPVGLGDPLFDGLENRISQAVFAVGGVKGISFGSGFDAAEMPGSQHNDPFIKAPNGQVITATNHHGGILGGLASGMPLLVKVAVKPTPSIGQAQQTLNLATGQTEPLAIKGRHDPCILPRAVPCLEAAIALALTDALLEDGRF